MSSDYFTATLHCSTDCSTTKSLWKCGKHGNLLQTEVEANYVVSCYLGIIFAGGVVMKI